jgi:hypothetical protein
LIFRALNIDHQNFGHWSPKFWPLIFRALNVELLKNWSLSYQKIGRHWSFRNVLGYLCTCLIFVLLVCFLQRMIRGSYILIFLWV